MLSCIHGLEKEQLSGNLFASDTELELPLTWNGIPLQILVSVESELDTGVLCHSHTWMRLSFGFLFYFINVNVLCGQLQSSSELPDFMTRLGNRCSKNIALNFGDSWEHLSLLNPGYTEKFEKYSRGRREAVLFFESWRETYLFELLFLPRIILSEY